MKKIITLLFALALTSCGSVQYSEYVRFTSYSDYKNFFITESNSVSFDYKPIGNLVAKVSGGNSKQGYIPASAENALYVLQAEAKARKANGIINLKIEYFWVTNTTTGVTSLSSVTATGMAIRR